MGEFEAFGVAEKAGWTNRDVTNNYVSLFAKAADQAMLGLVKAVSPAPGSTVLDMCCGHGAMTAKLCDLGCQVTGLDFSDEMLAQARSNAPKAALQHGDAQNLPFEDQSFDAVLCNCGIIHLPDQPLALAEARRVLKFGGTFGMTAWVGPDASPSFKIALGAFMAHADPSKGAPPQPDFFQFARPETAKQMLEAAGFTKVNHSTVDCVWQLETADQLFRIYSEATVRMAMMLAAQSRQTVEAIRSAMAEMVETGHKSDVGFEVPIPAVLITARV
jgi:ubiquinone/menaquinone biosynthesis C-methylase UbiE